MLKRRWKISNSIWAEPCAGQLYGSVHCSGQARWDDARVFPTPIKSDEKTGRTGCVGAEEERIIDRREKDGPRPLSRQ